MAAQQKQKKSSYENPMLSWLDETNNYLEENPRAIVQFLNNVSAQAEGIPQEGVDLICEYASCKCNREIERARQKVVKALYKQNKIIEVVVAPAQTLYNFYKNPWNFVETGLSVVKKVLGVLYGPVMAFAEFTASLVKEIARLAKNLAVIVNTLPPKPINPKVNFNKFHIDIGSIGINTITEDPSNLPTPEEMFPMNVPIPFSKEFFQAIGENNRENYRKKSTYITGTYAERVEGIPVRSTITEGDTQQYWGEGIFENGMRIGSTLDGSKYWGEGVYTEGELLAKPSIDELMEKTLDESGRTVENIFPSYVEKTTPSYSSVGGNRLAEAASQVTNTKSDGLCLRGVNRSLQKAYGSSLQGLSSAYQAADALRGKPVTLANGKTVTFKTLASKFTEVSGITRSQLKNLPAGAIVVWNNNANGGGSNVSAAGKKHGHISIALGNGKESSDYIGNQITNRDAQYTVFFPKEVTT